MKKQYARFVLFFALTAALCCMTAFAAGEKGVYNVQATDESVDITPQTAAQGTITPDTVTVDGTAVNDFYADAERFEVTVGAAGDQCVIFVVKGGATDLPTEKNLVYIDQQTSSGGSACFHVYPSSLTSGSTYTVFASDSGSVIRAVGSFQYYAAYKLGDVDGNEKLTSRDAQYVVQIVAKLRTPTEVQKLAADVDGRTGITSRDAQYIVQAVANLRTLGK